MQGPYKGSVGKAEIQVERRTASLSGEVRRVLPKLAHKSRHWTSGTVCPDCGDMKTAKAKRCWECFLKDRNTVQRSWKAQAAPPMPQDQRMRPAYWRRGMVGQSPKPPEVRRMALGADGVWRVAEE